MGTPPNSDLPNVEENAGRYSLGFGTQNIGDQIVSAKTVLPWFLSTVGGPAWAISLLVPIRESGSMLPQAFLRPWLQSHGTRLPLMIAGSIGQAAACAVMALTALFATGTAAALLILAALGLLALSRALVSLTSKDIAGRTIPKGYRGRLTGFATTLSGAVAILVGVGVQSLHGNLTATLFSALFAAAGASWLASAVLFRGITEGDVAPKKQRAGVWEDIWDLMVHDRPFRNFVIVRTMLLTSALSPAFLVAMSHNAHVSGAVSNFFTGLGTFVIAAGVASLMAGRISGWLADKSSRNTMTWAAVIASTVLAVTVILYFVGDATTATPNQPTTSAYAVFVWWLPVAFFIISLAHVAVRVARSTYVVDMAEGDQRTRYVSVANTMMGVLLLAVGGITGALAAAGPEWALLTLAVCGFAGAVLATRLPEVSAG
ncbi:MAG TPA: MFS transporter [Candidatus Corynebacterium gallistercoris]|uniref:MFS transporter n=1 Tax=Candidatus Corynebacterium gallistercoris TaxID=2838530 RepID=A0A9D1UPQ3_9CORY|nr:MFS transporter [Candidatus Corynebacterium gallistercoris]